MPAGWPVRSILSDAANCPLCVLKQCKTLPIIRRLSSRVLERLGLTGFSNATRCRTVGSHGGIFVVRRIERRNAHVAVNILARAARQSLRMLAWQTCCVVAVALALAIFAGGRAAWSVLIGGGIGLVWTAYMTLVFFKHSLTHGVRLSAATFLLGWLVKLVLTIGLLVAAFRSGRVAGLPLLGGLGTALVAYWAWLTFRVTNGGASDGGK